MPGSSVGSPAGSSGAATAQVKQVGGWRLLIGGMLAAAGLGFAGYLYAVPYQKLARIADDQAARLQEERAGHARASADRETLKAELGKHLATDAEKSDAVSRRRQSVEDLAGGLRTSLGPVGAVISMNPAGNIDLSFPATSIFDQPVGTGVSGQGETTLKILAAAVQNSNSRVTVKARLIPAPPPRVLAQFKTIGEFAMLRAVRVALSIADSGVKPESIAAAGASPLDARRGKPAIPDRLEVEIERE